MLIRYWWLTRDLNPLPFLLLSRKSGLGCGVSNAERTLAICMKAALSQFFVFVSWPCCFLQPVFSNQKYPPLSFYLGGRVGDRQPWGARFCAMILSHVTHIDNHCHLSWGTAGKAHRRKDGGQDPRDKQTPEIISFFCRICEHCISKLELVHLEDSKKFRTSRLVSKFLAHLP